MEERQQRNYSIDILKIILAILIIINHSITHGIKEYYPEFYTNNIQLLKLLTIIANPAVDCFFLISGYYGIKRSIKSAISLLTPVIVVSYIYTVVLFIIDGFSIKQAIKGFVLPFESWWFVCTYLMLWLLSPYINKLINDLEDKQLYTLTFILLAISVLQGCILNGSLWGSGFSFDACITIYFIGACIKRLKNTSNIYI